MLAFASNSILGRLALKETAIDPITFTSIRIAAGALVLTAIIYHRDRRPPPLGSWFAAIAMFVYALGFSLAYVNLSSGIGALLLFAAVQVTMISYGIMRGERLGWSQWLGVALAIAGLVTLVWPGNVSLASSAGWESIAAQKDMSTPADSQIIYITPQFSAGLMLLAGIAWGVYSLLARGVADATAVTAGNFLRALPLVVFASAMWGSRASWDAWGVFYALVSGGVTSGLGYVIWYQAVKSLPSTIAATVQLSVPILVAIGGVLLLSESLSQLQVLAASAILIGVAMVVINQRQPK